MIAPPTAMTTAMTTRSMQRPLKVSDRLTRVVGTLRLQQTLVARFGNVISDLYLLGGTNSQSFGDGISTVLATVS
jgi:hypothetical protein